MDPGIEIVLVAVISLYVLIPALAIGLGLRLAGVGRRNKPEDILRKRLASGEITPTEFDDLMATLRH